MFASKTLFFLTAAATTVFIVTILAMVAMLVGNPDAPVNIWFNKHGATVLTIEIVAIGGLGLAAMVTDRRETLMPSAGRSKLPQMKVQGDKEERPSQP